MPPALLLLLVAAPAASPMPDPGFDLKQLDRPITVTGRPHRNRYLPHVRDLPTNASEGVEIKLRWRRIRLRMPIPSI